MEIKPIFASPAPIAHTISMTEPEAVELTQDVMSAMASVGAGRPLRGLARLHQLLSNRNAATLGTKQCV